MALVLPSAPPRHAMDDFFYDPLRFQHSVIPSWHQNQRKPWLNDFGYVLNSEVEAKIHEMQRMLGKASKLAPHIDSEGFHVCVDVHKFKPEEITLKTNDLHITVEGKHEERKDEHGFIMRQFSRRYTLPKGYDPEHVTSEMSTDGFLTIKAPKPLAIAGKERQVTIQQTEKAHLGHYDIKAIK